MLIYIDLEHDRLKQQSELWEKSLARRLKTKYRLEELSGQPCLIVRYHQVNPALLRELNVRAVIVSGCHTDFEHYRDDSLAGLRTIYREAAQPLLGFCAGMQLLAQTYGAEIGPLGPLPPGQQDPYGDGFGAGMKQERGFRPVRLDSTHRLFDGLPRESIFFQAHYWEVKTLPEGFRALAESDLCGIQAIAHRDRPLFGTQFHPEKYDDDHTDGRKVLENFLNLIRTTGN